MKQVYEMVGGPIDGGIIHLEQAEQARTVALQLPGATQVIYYTSDPTNPAKFLYLGAKDAPKGILGGDHAAN